MEKRFLGRTMYPAFMMFVLAACAPELTTSATTSSSGSTSSGANTSDSHPIDLNGTLVVSAAVFGITTNGSDWDIAWQGEAAMHQFAGTISCPSGCELMAALSQSITGDSVSTPGTVPVEFKSAPGNMVPQSLHVVVSSLVGSKTPLTFDLLIDGAPAAPDKTYYLSKGVKVAASEMPLSLTPSE